jgi:hypothetical protein
MDEDVRTVSYRAYFEKRRKVMEHLERRGLVRRTGQQTLCHLPDGEVFLDEEWVLTEEGARFGTETETEDGSP